jgi:hypothetical protein
MCYVIDLVWFSLRIITNYEYCEDEFLPVNAILESASEDNQNLNSARSLGMLIRDVWEGKVKKVSKSDNGAGYLNLRKRSFNELHKNNDIIRELTDKTVEDIRLLCADRPNWVIDSSLLAKKSIVLMHPLNPDRSEAVAIDGHRLTMEINLNMGRAPSMTISTCGKEVSFSDIRGVDVAEVTLRTIDEAICILENASTCIGQAISPDDEYQFLKLEVAGTNVVTITSEDLETHKRLVSTSCLLFRFRCKACKHCLYTAKLHRNRCIKRKVTSASTNCFPHKKCDLRFLDQMGLEEKISMQKKHLKNEFKRECRVIETEKIELVDEDHLDLMEIVKITDPADVPSNLKLLWEQQMKQLSMKSSNGHRWDPRCLNIPLKFATCLNFELHGFVLLVLLKIKP